MSGGSQEETLRLQRSLRARHILMMALGGAIGAGLFKGSADTIHLAGPSVVLAYVVGGIILLFVMRGLADMTVQQPQAGTFRDLLAAALGPFPAHVAAWMYWLDWVLVMAVETTTAASLVQRWLPTIPLWVLSLIISIAITVINLNPVRIYGETEYWLASIKIGVLILFILLGGTLLFTGYSHHPAPGFHNVWSHGGLFPNGMGGWFAAMIVVMFSFGGTEMVGMTMGETHDPERVIPRVARGVMVRILLFYVLPILVIISLVPWDQVGAVGSPFVTVFQAMGIPAVPDILNFVILTAVLSTANSGMFAASRVLYSQALDGQAPRWFARLSRNGVPVRALLVSTSFLYVGVVVAMFAGGHTFDDLMVIPGYSVVLVWTLLALAHVRTRTRSGQSIPLGSLFAVLALLVIFIGIVATSPWFGSALTLAAICLIALLYVPYRFAIRSGRDGSQ
ncbi:putative amino acid permease YvbW [Alicyclobacillus contaminans]|uniref:amino acid permease n=1 Tax=Alicyclobacillus contaminans TaxID=392016 RepID=UPI000422950F|nr:amino acid permease [Alicyclobacillus contaminans]GMA51963.1 putative amino acid permease YvbW [Alicyclobacillus contaminans]